MRVGLIQNSIALPTTVSFLDQKRAIYQKLKPIIEAAGASGVNILCLQVVHGVRVEYSFIDSLPSQVLKISRSLCKFNSGSMDDAICLLYTGEEVVRICRAC